MVKTKHCDQCGTAFQARRSDTMYYSKACKQAALRARRRSPPQPRPPPPLPANALTLSRLDALEHAVDGLAERSSAVTNRLAAQVGYLLDPALRPTRSAGYIGLPSGVSHFHGSVRSGHRLSSATSELGKQARAAALYYDLIGGSQGRAAADRALLEHMSAPGGLGDAMKRYFSALEPENGRVMYHTFEYDGAVPDRDPRRYNQFPVASAEPIAMQVDSSGNVVLAEGASPNGRPITLPDGVPSANIDGGFDVGFLGGAQFGLWMGEDGTLIVAPAPIATDPLETGGPQWTP